MINVQCIQSLCLVIVSFSRDECICLWQRNPNFKIYTLSTILSAAFSYKCSCRIHTDAMNNRRRKTSLNKIFTSHFIVRVRKGLLNVFVWEGAGDRTELKYLDPPLLWPSTLCLSHSPDVQPEALGSTLLGAGFLYCILSASSLDPNSIRAPEGPFGRVWLSLPHLVYLRLQLYCNCNSTVLTSVLTGLYNSSTSTQSPTRSSKSHV